MTARQALALLIAVSTVLRLVWASLIGPGHDEAYYFTFSLHPDWSYYDHPPLVAWVITLTHGLFGQDSAPWASRIAFILLFSASTWLLARLTARSYGERAGVFAAFLLNLSGYEPLAAGSFALPDGPLTFFWLLALERLSAVLLPQPSVRRDLTPWILVGLGWGGALFSKYHALALPLATLLYLLLEPSARPLLRRPGPYLALAIGVLFFAPVLGWNAAHSWVSFRFHGLRTVEHGLTPKPGLLFLALLGQAAYVCPWIWLILLRVTIRGLRARRGSTTPADRFHLVHTLAPLVLFLAPACFRPLLPHWSLAALLAAYPLAGHSLERRWKSQPKRLRRALVVMTSAIIVFASFIVTHTHVRALFSPLVGRSQQIAASLDPTVDTQGWREIAAELDHRGFIGKPGTFIFTSRWYNSGQLACALKQRATVLCYNPGNAHAFAQWSHPESSVGRDGLLVVVDHSSTEPAVYDRWFDQIRPAGEFSVLRSGRPIRRIRLYHCLNQSSPFPSSHSEIALQPVPSPSTSEQVAVRLRQYQSDSSPASRTR